MEMTVALIARMKLKLHNSPVESCASVQVLLIAQSTAEQLPHT